MVSNFDFFIFLYGPILMAKGHKTYLNGNFGPQWVFWLYTDFYKQSPNFDNEQLLT